LWAVINVINALNNTLIATIAVGDAVIGVPAEGVVHN